ncbi:MAG: leucyl aminopeptidase [Bacteroidota bacterium]|nr:leucyl aminopeptidase [Bacteroidota bacterium]MDX5429374.1 leucyl aminopeptidase [Bacteroidota bacterium]MDX5448108.1 leucyl aminopeptidase [Bacteroidota bacterium]MDX5506974.1 leucyl aminopeptidase [Bacteroidota bacterium]
MKIISSTGHVAGISQAFVIHSLKDLPKDLLTKEEQVYLKGQLDPEKRNWVMLNRFTHGIYVCMANHDALDAKFFERLRKSGASLGDALNRDKVEEVEVATPSQPQLVLYLAEGLALGNYRFLRHFSNPEKKRSTLQTIRVVGVSEVEVTEVSATVEATFIARDLVNEPVNYLNAEQLAQTAEHLGKENGFSVEVLNKNKIEALKMGGLLSINKGSIDPPTFTIMEYKPEKAVNSKPIILVGKGVVYDTGGLSLKPTSFMDTMKSDMAGAAAVIGTMVAVSKNKLPYHVIGLVPATDNRPGGNAITPGDVVTMFNGKTVEILNTDAEGRMILADALAYAQKYDPEVVIDLATLTGAAARAVGKWGIVAMGKYSRPVFEKLTQSGEMTYERVVEFPFWEEYDDLLKSDIADLKNIGGAEGGAITAGKFLANFTNYPYIHLDIAGPAFIDSNEGYRRKGATGVGVRLLYDFIKNHTS